MIVPWQEIAAETLDNLIKEFVLREGTDYGSHEVSLEHKIEEVRQQIRSGEAVILFSELHQQVDIKLKRELNL